ncbi:MAG: methionine--tRNA ligase [Bifidobacteriaceae bacterium]|jgi:methionyl-tRNA synthetase|nr:methionine--tRNA ligase [Bifidobacteriaceae bacterium]
MLSKNDLSKKKVLILVAWPYANGPRHIGHVAGFGVPSDIYARYMRMAGHEVLMVSGTDEHGTPIAMQAERDGISPQELVDKYNKQIVQDLYDLGLSYNLFTRTTTVNHAKVVQEMFLQLYKNGYIYQDTMKQAEEAGTGKTLPDRYIEGKCPKCGYFPARGDQCDNCGSQLDPLDLINPVSKNTGKTPIFVDSVHFFLDLPALKDVLTQWLESRKNWRPNVLKYSLNIIKETKPRAITRDIDWGIEIPLPNWKNNPNKKLYVWFDAVIGYLSACIEWARRQGDDKLWKNFWNDPNTLSDYFMGKDNIAFHSQIWPSELLGYQGLGIKSGQIGKWGKLNLPTEVVSSEFLTMEGKKFASSRGIVIYVKDILEKYPVDALRYYIAAAGPENNDTDFTWESFVQRNNSELVGSWGNLVNRTLNMVYKRFGKIPDVKESDLEKKDLEILDRIKKAFLEVEKLILVHKQQAGIEYIMKLVNLVNAYIAATEPYKQDDFRARQILWICLQAIYNINIMLAPYIPHSAQKVLFSLGIDDLKVPMPEIKQVADLDNKSKKYPIICGDYQQANNASFVCWEFSHLPAGKAIDKPSPIFEKIDPKIVEQELGKFA